jgi:hypothetical protein
MLENKPLYHTGSPPQIEIQFYSQENALKAVKLLANPEIETSKIAIQEMFFAGNGRMLVLKFSPASTTHLEFIRYISIISKTVSLVKPVSMSVTVPSNCPLNEQ